MAEKLEDLHLADLHRRAAKLGIPRYRLLRRDRLVAEIQSGDGEAREGPVRDRERLEEAAGRERALVHVDRVNGSDPPTEGRLAFEDLTPVVPRRRVPLGDAADIVIRAVDLLTPLALGQRVLVMAAPR